MGLNAETEWLVRIARPGLFECQLTLASRIGDDEDIVVAGTKLESLILQNFQSLAEMADELDLGGPAYCSILLEGIEQVRIAAPMDSFRFRIPALHSENAYMQNPKVDAVEDLRDIVDRIWESAGRPLGSPTWGK